MSVSGTSLRDDRTEAPTMAEERQHGGDERSPSRVRLIGQMMVKLNDAVKLGREARLTLDEIQFLLGRVYEQAGGDNRHGE